MDTSTQPLIAAKTVVARFESASKPGSFHEVRFGADGVLYCTCPSWRFQKNHPSARACKHTNAFVARTSHGGVSLSHQGTASMPTPIRQAARRTNAKPAPTDWQRLGR